MNNVTIEESGWILDFAHSAEKSTALPHLNGLQFAMADGVPGGTRGMIHFSRSDIRAFMVLFKKYFQLEETARKDIADSELFDNTGPLKLGK